MARQKSFIKLEGTIDDLTFYKGKNGYKVRKKSGISRQRIANDPAFARTRENGQEFGHIASMGKYLRRAVLDMLTQINDTNLVPRVVRMMGDIKNLDFQSPRGQRQVSVALQAAEGRDLLRGFDFNGQAPLQAVLKREVQLDPTTGTITVPDFNPADHLAAPEGATHASLQAGFCNLDFSTGETSMELSPGVEVSLSDPPSTLTLQPAEVPEGNGNQLFLLLVEFHQELNGVAYPINNGAFNALGIVEVL